MRDSINPTADAVAYILSPLRGWGPFLPLPPGEGRGEGARQINSDCYSHLRKFGEQWPDAAGPLDYWYRVTRRARWHRFADVKATFGQTDQAKVKSGNTVLIFDVGGNKYRLIAAAHYRRQIVFVLRVLTHKEYDAGRWKEQL